VFLSLLFFPLLTGCVRRLIDVRTDPEGARTFIDGREVGTSPVEIEFVHYGTRELVFRHPEHRTVRLPIELDAPWWQYPPFDFFTELVYPGTIEDRHLATVELPARDTEPLDDEALIERADAARNGSGGGSGEPRRATKGHEDGGTARDRDTKDHEAK